MGKGSFPGDKVRPGRAADHSPPSSAAVMEEKSYTSTHTLGHTGPVTGSLYLCTLCTFEVNDVLKAGFASIRSLSKIKYSRLLMV